MGADNDETPLAPPAFNHTLPAETLAERHHAYKKRERNARRALAAAQEALELIEADALLRVPEADYVSKPSDKTLRSREHKLLLAANLSVVGARTRVTELEDQLREAEDFCSDLAYYQRERQNQAAALFVEGSRVFAKAVELYATLKGLNSPRAREAA